MATAQRSITLQRAADRIGNIPFIGRQQMGPRGRLGPLGHNRLAMRPGHRPDDVGMPHQLGRQRLRFVVGQVDPGLAMTSTASGVARPPIMAEMPADSTITPWSASSAGGQPILSASICRHKASAIGLRQVLPVQTNRTIKLESRRSVCSETTPALRTFKPSLPTPDHGRGLAQAAAAVVDHQIDLVPQLAGDFLGRHGVGLAAAVGAGQGDRTGHHPQHVDHGLMGRHAQAQAAVGGNRLADARGKLRNRLSPRGFSTTSVTGPGQQRRAKRRPSRVRFGT